MTTKEVADSTDWLATPLAGLAAVEASLRCRVCKDFYTTPMLTSCFHTFCSLCIRRALSSDGKCPLCRTSEQELKLRSNWALEETVEAFRKARQETMDIARGASKRKIQNDTSEGESAPQPKRQRFSLRLSKGDSTQKSVEEQPEDTPSIVIQDSEDDKEDLYIPEPDDGLVACPMCERRMKEWQVFKHIESCTGPTATPKRGESSRHSIKADTPNIPPNRLERLPALNYSILKEKGLRQKLAELGLPASGSRLTMESRHKEWMTLWNANCDAIKPKKRAELLRDLDTWERTQGAMALGRGQSGVMVKDKNFDAGAWAKEHDESFHDLIAQARKSRDEARRKAQQPDNKDKEKASDLKVDVKDDMHTGQNWVKPDEDMKDG